MYSSYSAAAFALRTSKPPSHAHSYFPSHHYHHAHDGGGGGGHHNELLPLMNPHLTPRFLFDGYLLRHSAHLLLLSARLRPPRPPRPPHCCRRRVAARCFCSSDGRRLEGCECRCCGRGTGRSDLGVVCRRLEVCGCRCGGSGSGGLDLVASCGQRNALRLVGRAVRQEVWEYEGGEWPHSRCSMECHGDWEEEDDECGLAQWEVPGRLHLSRWRWEEDDDRCRDCHRRKGNYYDDVYSGQQRERDVNERHGGFRDSHRRKLEQRDYRDDEHDLDLRRHRDRREGRERRDVEFEDAVDMRRARTRRYGEDDRKYDRMREIRDFDFEEVVDANRVGASRYTEDDRRFGRRTERRDFEIDDDDVRRDGRLHSNDNQRYVTQHQRRAVDREEEDVSLLGSRRWHDQEYDYDDHGIAEQRYHPRGRSHKSARASALHEDNSRRASSSRNKFDTRLANREENSTSRERWHDNVDRRAELTSGGREQRYSSSVGRSNDEKDEYDHEDARFVKVKDSRTGTQDVRVITEDDTSLASSSKTTSILKRHSNVDQQVAALQDESRKSSQKVMKISEVRGNNVEWDSKTQSYHQEDRGEQIENRSSSLRSSVKMANDSRRQIDQHDEVDQQVVALTDSRNKSEKLTDIAIDSTRNVSRASHSEKNYDEVNQKNIDDRSISVHNITHITRDKKRYVNQQVIHETDIDVQNVPHVDVSKVRASDISVNRSSQNQLETRSDVNSTSNVNLIERTRGQQEQIHPNNVSARESAIIRGSQSHLETGVSDWVHSTSVTNTVDRTKERQEQVELTKTHSNNASTSPINTIGSVKEQIDLTKIHASDTTVVSSSQGLDTRKDNQAHRTSAVNLIDRATESRNNSDLQMTLGSSIERNDLVRTKSFQSSQDSRERLRRLEEAEKLMQHDMDMNWQQAGTTRTSDDKEITSLRMESNEEGSSIVNADMAQRGTMMGSSEQRITSETAAGSSVPSGSSDRHSVKESLLESAARLEKSSTFHVGKFVDELQKGVSDVNATLTKKNEKSIMEGVTRSSSRSKMRGPSDEMWDVQSATSQETFKTADKEEGSSADGVTNSASQTPKNETALARKVHKSLWAYVADIIRLGWIQRGESHDSSNKSVKKSSSSSSQSTEGWVSSLEHDNDVLRKKTGSLTPKDQQLIKSHTGESEPRVASTLKEESLHTGAQGLQISEANNAPQVVRSKRDFVARGSKDDIHASRERAKQSDMGASPKGNNTGGFVEDGRLTSVDVTIGHLPEHEAVTSSRITSKGSAEVNTGVVFANTSSMIINTEEAGRNYDTDDWRSDPSGAITPYHHPQTSEMMPNENNSAAILESGELPTGGSTRFEEKIVIQEPPEAMRTEGKDAELKRGKFQRNKQVLKETFDEWEEAYQRDAEQRKTDELFMREALLEAQRAADIWEVPVGAVLVQNGEIIARGCNLVEDLRDSTAHAEIVCIREASNKLRTWRLADTTLYVTLEPCAMCAGAILQARVDTVVWGAPNKLLGADGSWVRLFPGDGQTSTLDSANQNQTGQTSGPVHPFHPKITRRHGVLSDECSEIMQQFFHLRRKKKQKPESPPHAHPPGRNHPIKFFTKMHNMFGTIFCI